MIKNINEENNFERVDTGNTLAYGTFEGYHPTLNELKTYQELENGLKEKGLSGQISEEMFREYQNIDVTLSNEQFQGCIDRAKEIISKKYGVK